MAGPMTAAIPALGNSLVLHSLDKTTSLFMHVSPALMAWALRWYPSPAQARIRADNAQEWSDASLWDLVVLPMILYSIWATFYYLKVGFTPELWDLASIGEWMQVLRSPSPCPSPPPPALSLSLPPILQGVSSCSVVALLSCRHIHQCNVDMAPHIHSWHGH